MTFVDELQAKAILQSAIDFWDGLSNDRYTEEQLEDFVSLFSGTILPKYNQIIEAENLKVFIAEKRPFVQEAFVAVTEIQKEFLKRGFIAKAQAIVPVPAAEIKSIVVKLGIIASAGTSADQAMKRASLIEQQPAGQRAHFTTMENIRHDLDNYLNIYTRYSTELIEILESPEIEDIKEKAQKEFTAAVDALRRLAAWTHSLIALGVKPHSETEKSEFMRMESAIANELKKKKVAV